MAELEKIKADQKIYKAFIVLEKSTLKTLEMAYKAIKKIEK